MPAPESAPVATPQSPRRVFVRQVVVKHPFKGDVLFPELPGPCKWEMVGDATKAGLVAVLLHDVDDAFLAAVLKQPRAAETTHGEITSALARDHAERASDAALAKPRPNAQAEAAMDAHAKKDVP